MQLVQIRAVNSHDLRLDADVVILKRKDAFLVFFPVSLHFSLPSKIFFVICTRLWPVHIITYNNKRYFCEYPQDIKLKCGECTKIYFKKGIKHWKMHVILLKNNFLIVKK